MIKVFITQKIFNTFFNKSFLYFLIIGGANTILSLGIMLLLYNALSFGYWLSSATSFFICSIISYILNRRISFKSNAPILSSAIKFSIVIAVCYFIAFSLAKPIMLYIVSFFDISMSLSLIEQLAMLIAQAIFTTLNFLGQKLWAFKG